MRRTTPFYPLQVRDLRELLQTAPDTAFILVRLKNNDDKNLVEEYYLEHGDANMERSPAPDFVLMVNLEEIHIK